MNERLRNRQSSGRRRIGVLHAAAAQERLGVLCNEEIVMVVYLVPAWRACNARLQTLAKGRLGPQLARLSRFG
jgi:hypothetical protein